MANHPDITTKQRAALHAALEQINETRPVACAYLYGSRTRGEASQGSDYDIAIFEGSAGAAGTADAELELCAVIEKRAGVAPVDVRICDRAPLMVRGKILTEGLLLFCGDEEERVRIERDTRVRYFEFANKIRALDRMLLERIAEEGI